jgi:hypothetical protein
MWGLCDTVILGSHSSQECLLSECPKVYILASNFRLDPVCCWPVARPTEVSILRLPDLVRTRFTFSLVVFILLQLFPFVFIWWIFRSGVPVAIKLR